MAAIIQNRPKKPNLPNATKVLVFGILSIAICSFVGLAFGIVALVVSNKEMARYMESPDSYSINSYGMLNAGRTCAIIGTILSAVATLFMIIYFIFLGVLFTAIFSSNSWYY
jgi:uncharacterized membrane protein